MDYEEYQTKVIMLDNTIKNITSKMIDTIHQDIIKNKELLSKLIIDTDFDFISLDDHLLDRKTDQLAIELFRYGQEVIYYSALESDIVYFQNTSYDVEVSQLVSDELLVKMFETKDLFKKVHHVTGISGILEKNLNFKRTIIEDLSH